MSGMLDHRDATERAQRRLAGEHVPDDPPRFPPRVTLDYGERYDEQPVVVCPTCGGKSLTLRGTAHRPDAAVAFVTCDGCSETFGVQFVAREGAVAVEIYEPAA